MNYLLKNDLFFSYTLIGLPLCSGDSATLSRLQRYLDSGEIMRDESLRHASLPCLPFRSDYNEESYRVESTGAVVTLSSSVGLIYFYCSRLPSDWSVILYCSSLFENNDTAFLFCKLEWKIFLIL